MIRMSVPSGEDFAGCSKSLSSKAAASEDPEAQHSHPSNPELSEQLFSRVGYVEDLNDARTMLAGFFSILLPFLSKHHGPHSTFMRLSGSGIESQRRRGLAHNVQSFSNEGL